MIVEVLNTGTELLLGDVVNTHVGGIASRVTPLGLRISRQSTVPDGAAIRSGLAETLGRCDILFVTGGLGPTTDDLTREITAELLGMPLEFSTEVAEAIRLRLARRGYEVLPRMLRQAMVPRGAVVLANPHGTAPGLYIASREMAWRATPHIFLLPGPPRELEPMLDDHVMPIVRRLAGGLLPLRRRTYHIVGMGESAVEQVVGLALMARGDVEVGYCARPNEVDLRLIAPDCVLDEIEPLVLQAVGDRLVSKNGQRIEEAIVRELSSRGLTLAVAESCTGGLLAHRITNVPGASGVFHLGLVTYANEQKISLLGVPASLMEAAGAVSPDVAGCMASGVLERARADFAISLTGIAGPGGGSESKPVGTVYVGLAQRGQEVVAERAFFPSDRATFKQLATQFALDLLRKRLFSGSAKRDLAAAPHD